MVAYVFVLLGVVRERVALTVVFLDILLYSVGGVIGTMHHLYFSGEPAEHMALGAVFSAAEVIPLTFLTVEAWSFLQLGARQEGRSATPFPHRWAVMFLVAVGFWNFLGAGIFGFLINLPIVSYYEIGTALTANHGHAAMMGVYGMLAVGLALFCLRYLIPDDRWPERLAKSELLVAQHRPRVDDVCDPVAAWPDPALRVGRRGVLRGSLARVPDQRHERADRVDPLARRRPLHRRWRRAAALHLLSRRPLPGQRETLVEPDEILFTEITAPTPETSAAVSRCEQTSRHDERRGPARDRLRGVSDARGNGPRSPRPPFASAQRPIPYRRLRVPLGARPVEVSGGPGAAPRRHRSPPAPRALSGESGGVQRLPRQAPVHRLRQRDARSRGRSIRGRTRRRAASIAASASSWSSSRR